MDALHAGHRSLWIITAYAFMGNSLGYAQTSPSLVVTPAQQAERDAMRRRILEAELAAESATLASARNRHTDRGRAGDSVGQAEAQAAIGTHDRNITALRRELDLVTSSPRPTISMAASGEMRELSVLPAHAPTAGTTAASCPAGVVQVPRPQWDLFQPRSNPVTAACTSSAEGRPTSGVMWLTRRTPSSRHEQGENADERRPVKARTSRDLPLAPPFMYGEPGLTPPPASTKRDNGKTIEGRPTSPTP